VLIWLDGGENPSLESFGPASVRSPPHPNPEAWWLLAEAINHANTADRSDHNKVPWIKTGDTILGPDQIKRTYSASRPDT
jgi:hypothetical protein